MRPYLLWMSAGAAGPTSRIFDGNRQYDVAYHDYGNQSATVVPREAEYYWAQEGEKLNVAGKLFSEGPYSDLLKHYRAVVFLDDDLSFTPDALNRCFLIGDILNLGLWQPALTGGSYSSHAHLRQCVGHRGIRQVPFVEVMMPFFSQSVLKEALPTFEINESGWGLDVHVWPKLSPCYVIDGIAFGHYRRPARRERVMKNGLTPMQEYWIQQTIAEPENAPFFPPGYKKGNVI